MAIVLYLRTNGVVTRHAPSDLSTEGGSVQVTAETSIALHASGPFEPLAVALETSPPLRDVLLRQFTIPSLRGYARLRVALLLSMVVPTAMLFELDRELLMRDPDAALSRIFIDLLLTSFVLVELLQRTPRLPGISALALGAISLRGAFVAARTCGRDVSPLLYVASGLAFAAAWAIAFRIPTRARVVLELAGKLGISRSDLFAARQTDEPSGSLVAASIACAAGLPASLHLVHNAGAGLVTQALVVVSVAIVAPEIARRSTDFAPSPETVHPRTRRPFTWAAIFAGLTLSAAAITAARHFFDTGMEIAQCVKRLDAETKIARIAESVELTRAISTVRASPMLMLMNVVLFPFAEERIYRGLLQSTLVRRYGRAYGVFAASIAFGIAHLGIYEIAAYQTVLLGVGFGVAYLEGGFVAAFAVHAAWNLLQLV